MLLLEARVRGRVVHWPLRSGRLVVGRSGGSDIVIEDDSMSRAHLALTPHAGGARVEDLGSRNGVIFKGVRQDAFEVRLDEPFAAGSVLMTVRDGISLSQSAPVDRADGATGPGKGAARPEQGPAYAAAGLRLPSGLADLLGGVTDLEAAAETLLRYMGETHGLRSTALLSRSGNGWVLEANWGTALEVEELAACVGLPLDGASDGGMFLMASPWTESIASHETTRLVASLLRLLAPALNGNGVATSRVAVTARPSAASPPFVTVSPQCRALLHELDRLAESDLPLLLLGESGTGKEILAHRIHAKSPRHAGPFVAVNCAALPHELLEAELFGIEKGVATGVSPRPGRFALASGGTLFLDEIGDLPQGLQPKLLRVLESREVTPLGAAAPMLVDVRLVAATNRPQTALAESGSVRRDLLYRIAGASVTIPPLRERAEDVLPLARFFAKHTARSQGRIFRGIDLDAARALAGYAWPGNVRELRHVIGRAVALADGPVLHPGLLPAELTGASDAAVGDVFVGLKEDWRAARVRFDRLYFARLLERCGGNLSEAARLAGLSRSNLYAKLEELGLR